MEWTVTAPVIKHQKNYRFNPITNKHHEIIIKYCMGKDNRGLVMYMQDMLQQLIVDKVDIKSIPVIDQLFLLVRLRSLCIGTRLEVVLGTETQSKHRVSLIDLQKSINEHYVHQCTVPNTNGSVKVDVHYSKTWETSNVSDYVEEVYIDDKPVDYKTLDEKQQTTLIESLDPQHYKKIQKTIKALESSINKMVFVQIPGEDSDITISSDQFTHILRIIFADTLNNFIELMYVFVKILNFTLADVMALTPSDTQLYYQMFVKETNEREKAQKQNQNKNTSRSVPSKL